MGCEGRERVAEGKSRSDGFRFGKTSRHPACFSSPDQFAYEAAR
jgi:uncharacterized protein with PIN domain